MSIAHLLEDFEVNLHPGSRRMVFSDVQLEEFRLAAFEKGFSAGWDDALKSQGETQVRVVQGLEHRLEDLAFTYTEALNQMLVATEPVFQAILDQVLPDAADPIMAAAVLDKLLEIARTTADTGLVLTVPEESRAYMSRAVASQTGIDVRIAEEPMVSPDQVSIRVDDIEEQELDMGAVTDALRQAIEATIFEIKEVLDHG